MLFILVFGEARKIRKNIIYYFIGKMETIESKDIAKISRMRKFGGEVISKLFLQFFRQKRLKRLYEEHHDKSGMDFIDSVIDELEIKFDINEEEIKRIPAQGAFIAVSNHPFGGIDGILLLKLLSAVRPDIKIFSNYLLKKIDMINDLLVSDSPFEKHLKQNEKIARLKQSYAYLMEGKPIGIFPAGDSARMDPEKSIIIDKYWDDHIISYIKRAGVPIVPVCFSSNKSTFYRLLGRIHPIFKNIKFSSELIHKKNKTIKVNIGSPISVKDQNDFTDISRFGRFLRLKTYALGTAHEVKRFFKAREKKVHKVEPIVAPEPSERVVREINLLRERFKLFSLKNYEVICAPSLEMPVILNEIGRLREVTFRDVGEGTNNSIDLDEYDLYYHQLIIWDLNRKAIVGAYRMGKGKEIIDEYGLNGFYIKSLFKIKKAFVPVLQESIELGRSFIVKDYQREPLSLFLLWKGILYFLIKNPEYRYLIGPVSISNRYSTLSKAMIVEFIKANFYSNEYAEFIEPRKEFKIDLSKRIDKEVILEYTEKDIKKFDKFIKDVEPYYSMPVLLKKYLQQNAKIIGFNVDPKFNNCLDGLIILDLFDVPPDTIESMTKDMEDLSALERIFVKDSVKADH